MDAKQSKDGKHKITIQFVERHLDDIKALEKNLLDLVIATYEINEDQRNNVPFELKKDEDGTGAIMTFRLVEIKNKEMHHVFVDTLMKSIHTRSIFMYFQEIVFANKDITIFQDSDKQIQEVIKKQLKMEDSEKISKMEYSTMENGRTKMTFAIPVFYKETCDDVSWFKVFKKNKGTRNLCQFQAKLLFNIKQNEVNEVESLAEPIRNIIKTKLKMIEQDMVKIDFDFDKDERLSIIFAMPQKYAKKFDKTDWYKLFNEEEKTKHLIRIEQLLIFVNCTEKVLKDHNDDIIQIITDELGIKDIKLSYETTEGIDGNEVRLTINVPSSNGEKLGDTNWIDIISNHEKTRTIFIQKHLFNLKGVTYKFKEDFSMIKGFASDISKAPVGEISIEIGDKPQCFPMTVCIPERYASDDFQSEMGTKLKDNRHTLFEKIPKN